MNLKTGKKKKTFNIDYVIEVDKELFENEKTVNAILSLVEKLK